MGSGTLGRLRPERGRRGESGSRVDDCQLLVACRGRCGPPVPRAKRRSAGRKRASRPDSRGLSSSRPLRGREWGNALCPAARWLHLQAVAVRVGGSCRLLNTYPTSLETLPPSPRPPSWPHALPVRSNPATSTRNPPVQTSDPRAHPASRRPFLGAWHRLHEPCVCTVLPPRNFTPHQCLSVVHLLPLRQAESHRHTSLKRHGTTAGPNATSIATSTATDSPHDSPQ